MNETGTEIEIRSYPMYKECVDKALKAAVENFVLIGYLLRKAKDNPEILAGSGYTDYKDFAYSEYGLDPSQVSRFISINERYGAGAELLPQYQAFGQSKLAEMLSLPAAVTEELNPDITREEIRELKHEIAEEKKITDIEVAIERAENPDIDIWVEFIHSWARKEPEKFTSIDASDLYESLLRGCVLTARVVGEGKLMMTEADEKIKLTNLRSGEKYEKSLEEVETLIEGLFGSDGVYSYSKAQWESMFDEEFPEIAPAQPKAEEKTEKEEKKAENPQKVIEKDEKTSEKDEKTSKNEENIPKSEENTTNDATFTGMNEPITVNATVEDAPESKKTEIPVMICRQYVNNISRILDELEKGTGDIKWQWMEIQEIAESLMKKAEQEQQ